MGCIDMRNAHSWLDRRALLDSPEIAPLDILVAKRSQQGHDDIEHDGSREASPQLVLRLLIMLLLNALLSGGILNGIAPLQARLVQERVLQRGEASLFYASAFEIETIGTIAIAGVVMGILGARWTAVFGLLLVFAGHVGLVFVTRSREISHLLLAEIACGLIGLGGTALYFGSVSLAKAFGLRQGAVAGCLAGAWQITSCGFMPLRHLSVDVLCSCYAIIALMAVPLVLWALPKQHDATRRGSMCCLLLVDMHVLAPLADPKIWCFMVSFAWIASAAAWGTSVIYAAATMATATETSRDQFITWSPIAMLSSVIAPWLVGAMADRYGFALPGLGVILMLCSFLATIQSTVIWMLWLALWFLSSTVGSVYALQVVYLAARAPGLAFGPCLAISVLAQSLVQIATIALAQPKDASSGPDLQFAAAIWAAPSVLLVSWPLAEHIALKRARQSAIFSASAPLVH